MPDFVAQFDVGPICPPQADLDRLKDQVINALTDDEDVLELLRSVAVCTRRTLPTGISNVVGVGIWTAAGNTSELALRAELSETQLLTPGRTAALFLGTRLVQLYLALKLPLPQELGPVTLEDVDVSLGPDGIRTVLKGSVSLLVEIGFTYTIDERLSLRPPGSVPPLEVDRSTDLKADEGDLLPESLLVPLLIPTLAALVFFAAEGIEQLVPESPAAGSLLVAQWATEVMTEIRPPALLGKLVLSWTDLTVDEHGVTTLGTYEQAQRQPRVAIEGPTSVTIKRPARKAHKFYRVLTDDLRPKHAIRWSVDGKQVGRHRRQGVEFDSTTSSIGGEFTNHVRVRVTDADGLRAEQTLAVGVHVTAPPGTHEQ
jgi:hypothetical protein